MFLFFFFQAEDGIRDRTVTGVQTCALPIFDRWVERGGIKSALARARYDASNIVAKLVYYTVLLFTLQLAFGVWGPNPVSDLIHDVVAWLPNLLIAIVIVVVAAAIASGVRT